MAEQLSLTILLSSAKAGPGREVEQEQEEISLNHVVRLSLCSAVQFSDNSACKSKSGPPFVGLLIRRTKS